MLESISRELINTECLFKSYLHIHAGIHHVFRKRLFNHFYPGQAQAHSFRKLNQHPQSHEV